MKHTKITAALLSAAVMANGFSLSAFAEGESDFSGYVLMNIPYSAFYGAGNSEVADVDAVTSATNKTGNYGKAGGAFHSGTTASIAEDGTVSAAGGENGSKVQGVTWAVKADSLDAVKALGGKEITDESTVTTATAAHGNVSSNTLVSYQTLTEAPAYSYYVLDKAPDSYLVLKDGSFVEGQTTAVSNSIDITASYGTNWGDIQLNTGEAEAASDKIINGIVLTADDGTSKGLYALDQIWAFNQLAWKVDATSGLDGKKITGVRFYCSVKDTDLTDGAAPEYKNYIYDYKTDLDLSQVYTGEVTAKFKNPTQLNVTGLPEDAQNLKVKVYYTTGGRNATYTYITPLIVDPNDDDIDPVFAELTGGKLAIEAGSVTNNAGKTESFGTPVDGTEYTVELSSENYIFRKINVVYNAAEDDYTEDVTEPEEKPEDEPSDQPEEKPADDPEEKPEEKPDEQAEEQTDGKTDDTKPAETAKTSIKTAKATLSKTSYVYSGKAKKPTVKVVLGKTTLKKGTDYTVTYKNNKKVGKATVTIKGKGSYTGTISKTFKINPGKSAISKLTSPKAKKLKVTYKKVAGVTGYQVTVSTSKKFTKSTTRTIAVKGAKKTSATVSKLKAGKKYYVKVRAYKTVSGKRYYSSYTKVKSIKVKK